MKTGARGFFICKFVGIDKLLDILVNIQSYLRDSECGLLNIPVNAVSANSKQHVKVSDTSNAGSASKRSEGNSNRCSHCDRVGHGPETCFDLVGFPKWHPKGRNNNGRFQGKGSSSRDRDNRNANSTQFRSNKGGLFCSISETKTTHSWKPNSQKCCCGMVTLNL